jgi:hypothetical protein
MAISVGGYDEEEIALPVAPSTTDTFTDELPRSMPSSNIMLFFYANSSSPVGRNLHEVLIFNS